MSVAVALQYAEKLLKVRYRWWSGADMRGDVGPFGVSNAPLSELGQVYAEGSSCAGLLNLIRWSWNRFRSGK